METEGPSGGVLQVIMATVEALSCQLHPSVVEHGTGAHQGVVLDQGREKEEPDKANYGGNLSWTNASSVQNLRNQGSGIRKGCLVWIFSQDTQSGYLVRILSQGT